MTLGRPPTPQKQVDHVIDTLCAALMEGTPAAVVYRQNPDFPHVMTVNMWRNNNPEMEQKIAQARVDGWDYIAWRCRQVAAGNEALGSTGDVKRDKLIVETDLKLLAKWDPKRYGDRVQVDSTVKHEAANLETMSAQLVTQVTMNPTLKPVLMSWAQDLLSKLGDA